MSGVLNLHCAGVQSSGCNLHFCHMGKEGEKRLGVKRLTACEAGDIVVAIETMDETMLRRRQPMTPVRPPPKKPYTKPTLTKHKALRDITALNPASPVASG